VIAPEVLKGFPFFSSLNAAELKSLSIIAEEISFQRGDYIFRENDPARMLYLLLDGWVDIMINTDTRGEHCELVTTLTCGDVFGWSAVVEPYLYTASVACASPVKAIGFKGVDLLALFEIDPRLCCIMVKRTCQVIANRLRATRLQMASLLVTG
jgi:CRP/FNR family cyclic AMP-dependent transcriptional regulator